MKMFGNDLYYIALFLHKDGSQTCSSAYTDKNKLYGLIRFIKKIKKNHDVNKVVVHSFSTYEEVEEFKCNIKH